MYNPLCVLGVCQFIPVGLFSRSYLIATVVTNGILFHTVGGKLLLWWDTVANITIILYINFISKSQPHGFLLSLFAFVFFYFNYNSSNSNLLHIVGVQAPMNIAMWCHYLKI